MSLQRAFILWLSKDVYARDRLLNHGFHWPVIYISNCALNMFILSPVGEWCVAIPRVGSLKGYLYRIYERVWDRGTFIVTEAHFLIKNGQKVVIWEWTDEAENLVRCSSSRIWTPAKIVIFSRIPTCRFNDPLERELLEMLRRARNGQNWCRGWPS